MNQNITYRIIGQILLLVASLFVLAFLVLNTQSIMSSLLMGLLSCFQVFYIVREVNKTNKILSVFFDSVKFDDYTISYNYKDSGKSFEALGESLTMVSKQFHDIRKEKEAHYLFNQNILQNVGVGIIAFDTDKKIAFSNKLFHSMMQIPYCDSLQKIGQFNSELAIQLFDIEQKKKKLFKIEQHGMLQHFLMTSSQFIVTNQNIKLVVVQNIQPTIDQTEMDAWQKLIKVLTHEIMNSITPISSLAETAYSMLPKELEVPILDAETVVDLREALHTINRRSHGLIGFVQQYRSLTAIPQPQLAVIQIDELVQRVSTLFGAELQQTAITFETSVAEKGLELIADIALLEQVILNLLNNAKQAVEHTAVQVIRFIIKENEYQKIEISVMDTGCGILPDVLDKIFIPFFTTKPTGSGIGLSLSKQIMLMHGGTISVQSTVDEGSVFVLSFYQN